MGYLKGPGFYSGPFCLGYGCKQAAHNHPELRLETTNIEEVYKKVAAQFPELLHPNLDKVTLRPWGAKEFAIIDGQIGIRVMEW
ncbi:MAG: hypothetical protein H7289_01590 [Mucilaginibacter sp.]|nr:hypothetical protein [Mucilaginibacter sp.]